MPITWVRLCLCGAALALSDARAGAAEPLTDATPSTNQLETSSLAPSEAEPLTLPAPESLERVPVPAASTDTVDEPLSPLFMDGPPSASADRLSAGAFDAVGSYEPGYP